MKSTLPRTLPETAVPTSTGIRITREGWIWLVLTGLLFSAGIFKGINLVTLVAALLLAIWLVNALYILRTPQLGLTRILPDAVFARAPFPLEIEVSNGKATGAGLRVQDHVGDQRIQWFLTRLPASARQRLGKTMTLNRWGRLELGPIEVVGGYPFGLLERRIDQGSTGALVIYPPLGRLHRGRFRLAAAAIAPAAGRARQYRASVHPTAQSDLHGVRAFRNGDSPRWIHWRTSAHRGELMVREFEDNPSDNLVVLIDPFVPLHWNDRKKSVYPPLETVMSLAATLCWEWCRKSGDAFALGLAGAVPRTVHGVTGRALAGELLEALALEPGTAKPNWTALVGQLRALDLPSGPMALLSTRGESVADEVENALHRPLTFFDLSGSSPLDFFERADDAP